MKTGLREENLVFEIVGFGFYLFELYNFFHQPYLLSINGGIIEIYYLRFILLVLVLPLLYIFRLAYFFDWGDVLAYALSCIFKFNNQNVFFQVKLFQKLIYMLLSILLFFRIIYLIF
jgi:hypothetical protein